MSRVVVNEIEAKVGNDISFNDTVKLDTIKGKTTAGSVTVQGEGTATTNLQSGLVKAFVRYAQGLGAGSQELELFNVSSMTDTSTGVYTTTFTNNFTDGLNYTGVATAQNATHSNNAQLTSLSSSSVGGRSFNGSSAADNTVGQIFCGELA